MTPGRAALSAGALAAGIALVPGALAGSRGSLRPGEGTGSPGGPGRRGSRGPSPPGRRVPVRGVPAPRSARRRPRGDLRRLPRPGATPRLPGRRAGPGPRLAACPGGPDVLARAAALAPDQARAVLFDVCAFARHPAVPRDAFVSATRGQPVSHLLASHALATASAEPAIAEALRALAGLPSPRAPRPVSHLESLAVGDGGRHVAFVYDVEYAWENGDRTSESFGGVLDVARQGVHAAKELRTAQPGHLLPDDAGFVTVGSAIVRRLDLGGTRRDETPSPWGRPSAVAASAAGRSLAVGTDRALGIYDLEGEMRQVSHVDTGQSGVRAVAFRRTALGVLGHDGTVIVLDTPSVAARGSGPTAGP